MFGKRIASNATRNMKQMNRCLVAKSLISAAKQTHDHGLIMICFAIRVYRLTTPPDSPMGSQVMDSVSGQPMEVDSTSVATNACTGATSSDNTFYITGQRAELQHRTFNQVSMYYLFSTYHILPQ